MTPERQALLLRSFGHAIDLLEDIAVTRQPPTEDEARIMLTLVNRFSAIIEREMALAGLTERRQ